MSGKALVNSYGMSEKGSITMEDPQNGNYILEKDNRIYISVGDNIFEDTKVIIINDDYNVVEEDIIGMIAVSSEHIASFYYQEHLLKKVNYISIENRKWYLNGDIGFIHRGKVFVTGRDTNTITYNGLKISAEILNESILGLMCEYGLKINRCFCFNYPYHVNYIVCFLDYEGNIDEELKVKTLNKIINDYHIKITDFWNERHIGSGIEKISLNDIISKYTNYIEKAKYQ